MALFDKASGVVYTETTSAQVGSMVPTWMSHARGKRKKRMALRSRGKGCSSLQDMALRSCAYHVELFVPETLQWASWHYACRVYKYLLSNEALTYNAWNIFYDAYPNEIRRQQQFHVYREGQRSHEPTQLFSITSRLAKLDTSLVTFFCVRDFSLTFDHIKALIDIPTLGALILEQKRPGGISEVTARHFTDFARAVREKHAFQKLELFIMCDFDIEFKTILEGVTGWPALQMVGLQVSKPTVTRDMSHADTCWQPLEPKEVNRRSPSMTVFHPQSLWTSNFLNSCQKTQQLYTFIKSLDQPLLSPPPETLTEKYRSVCMTYGGWAERDIHMITEQIHEETKWFVRDLGAQPVKAPEAAQAIKRTQDGSDDTSKRRRVRQGKQTDVGSLLMAFK